jgi:hypothetical protein
MSYEDDMRLRLSRPSMLPIKDSASSLIIIYVWVGHRRRARARPQLQRRRVRAPPPVALARRPPRQLRRGLL